MIMIGLIGVLVIGVLIGFIVNEVAYGEPFMVGGVNGEKNILVAFEDKLNIIMYDNGDSLVEVYDSTLKQFKSGFMLKSNVLIIIGVDLGDSYRLNVYSSDGIDTFTAYPVTDTKVEDPKNTVTVGADISRWDIPTTGRSDKTIVIPEKEFDPDTLKVISGVPHSVQWTHDLNFDFMVVDTAIKSETDSRIKNALVEMTMINPIGKIIGTWNGSTDNLGNHGNSWHVEDNEMIGEYTLNATANYENFTQKSLLVSFFVTPLNSDGSNAKCPNWYFYNDTSTLCQQDCKGGFTWNTTSILCQIQCSEPKVVDYTNNICEEVK